MRDLHAYRAMELFGEVTPETRHKAKIINYADAFGLSGRDTFRHDHLDQDWPTIDYSEIECRVMAMNDLAATALLVLGATPSDIPGLWNAPGYPELTTGQLEQILRERMKW